jgi:hypothetical protein
MKSFLYLSLLLSLVTIKSFACGGGQDIVLNDDTVLRPSGLYFPVTDPNDEKPLLIEKIVEANKKCIQSSTNLAGALFGSQCPSTTRLVTDSNQKRTHQVTMSMPNALTVRYYIVDLSTQTAVTYEAQLGTRGGCGLQQVN